MPTSSATCEIRAAETAWWGRRVRLPELCKLVALTCVLTATAAAQSPQQYSLRVNGLPVTSIRPATRTSGEWFVPLAPVARALGADLKVDANGQSLRILRSDGVTTSYDGAT